MYVKANDWKIGKMKTRWGSCSIANKRIWLNLELAKKPLQCLVYIIVREMVHFFERYHNQKFKELIDTYLPNWRMLKNQLNNLPNRHADWEY